MQHAFSDDYIIASQFLPRSYVFRFQYRSCSFGIFERKVSENDRNDNWSSIFGEQNGVLTFLDEAPGVQ